MSIQTFVLIPTDLVETSLRVFRYSDRAPKCGKSNYGCDATIVLDQVKRCDAPSQEDTRAMSLYDGKWPTHCDACGQPFGDSYELQFNAPSLFRRSDTGELVSLRSAPAGAVYEAMWLRDLKWAVGPDGRAIMVKIPDKPDWTGVTTWHVDDRASNCTLPDDRVHKCWCRHGPLECLTIDKSCQTCSAGAGSIIAGGGWHGFLRDGKLVGC